ncbi:MAG: MFS transporter [Candidatus Lokiarchaeota archaeon]|nr:MFS transporter [Candidatus Lokiarchaeota archaeon]
MNLSSRSWYKWFILGIFWLNFFLSSGSWLFPLSIKYDIIFNGIYLSDIQRSLLLTLPMIGLVAMAFFSGLLIDKIGVRKSAIISFLIIIIFGFLRGLSVNFVMLSIFLIIFGMGIGIILSLPAKLISEWFPEKQYSTSHGIATMASGLGIFVFELINKPLFYENLFPFFGNNAWRVNFFLYSFLSLIGLVFWIIFSKDKPIIEPNDTKRINLVQGIKGSIKNKQIILLCILNIGVLSSYFGAKHFISEILGIKSIPSTDIFIIISIMSLGAMFGNIIMPKMADHYEKRKIFIFEGITLTAIFIILCGVLIDFIISEIIFLFLLGFSIGTVIPLISASVLVNVDKKHVATAMGLVIFFGNLGALILPNLFEIYAQTEFTYFISLLFFAIIAFIGTISAIFLNEPKKKMN